MITQETLDTLTIKAQSLVQELQIAISSLHEIKQQSHQLEVDRNAFHVKEDELQKKNQNYLRLEADLKLEKNALAEEREQVQRRTILLVRKEEELELKKKDCTDLIVIAEEKTRLAEERMQKALEQEAKLTKADELLASIKEREDEIQKQIAIDRERKARLDIREQKVQAGEQKIASYFPDS